MTTIQPLHNGILVQEIEEDTVRASGLVLPDSARTDGVLKMKVIAVGPGAKFEGREAVLVDPVAVEPGQSVLVNRHAGTEVQDQDVKYKLVRETDLLAIVVDGDTPEA